MALAIAPPLGMQPYEDPDHHFTISYPQGWHVKRLPNWSTTFYPDDPDEGTAVAVIPAATFKGEMTAAQVWDILLRAFSKQYPDLKVLDQRTRPLNGNPNGTITERFLSWTNHHRQPMKGWGELGAIKVPGKGQTTIVYQGFRAPAGTLDQVLPVFDRMLKSLKFETAKR